jgi:hypothetical protein
VATEFESMLLRQLLTTAKMGGGIGGYADMAIDAMASGISQAGGVGLARQIETLLGGRNDAPEEPLSLSHSSFELDGRSSG